MSWHHPYGPGPGIAPILCGLVAVALLAGLLIWIRRPHAAPRPVAGSGPPSARGFPTDPEELLATRYARGEIDETEYERRLTTLRAYTNP